MILADQDSLDIVNLVRSRGFCKVPSFFSSSEVFDLKKRLQAVYNSCETGDQIDIPGIITKNQYSIGKAARIYPSQYAGFPALQKFASQDLSVMSDLFFEGCNNKGLQVFSSYEYKSIFEVHDLPRNAFMHVDPYHSFKFFCYLTDTTKDNGALQVIPDTTWIGSAIRSENSLESLLGGDAYTLEKSRYRSNDLMEKRIYVEGSAGDLIILNTDVMHCGGQILSSGLERMTVIYHNRKF